MGYDYSLLLGKMKECGFTQETLGKAVGMCESTLNLKLNNKASFKQKEIRKICKILGIPKGKIGLYFFTEKVQKN